MMEAQRSHTSRAVNKAADKKGKVKLTTNGSEPANAHSELQTRVDFFLANGLQGCGYLR